MNNQKGKLYLIPTTLGDNEPLEVLPYSVKKIIEELNHFVVENEKTARRFIKKITPKKSQPSLVLYKLDKYVEEVEVQTYLDVCEQGISVGLLSEAGVPAIADPGADVVKLAHEKGIRVVPMVGPSSIVLAMMASGFNGQNFAFNGYLPIDAAERKKAIKDLERLSKEKKQSQIFIETPYRNEKMFADLKNALSSSTKLCIACDITLKDEYIKTLTIKEWDKEHPDLHKRPTIFVIHKE
ncbi:16S rRNA (cytidine1402-2'-O)-methyltransferase [Lutibacter agarilyticus]|uniref:16S rRNA (Cytidine1402-2'-O)-methyltransferase n=1 Tax=Lutibacter agarilyticus TaxID=1109740 RepID=A0A238X1R5_9FLAO|nr:SAM-dependent methyltransferase [Lutibacter agarilyticus]SNR51789.1 16S rRNA (cytidine1402-2'-O)-methyltransferase [Lutibacter agarilyticus]